MSLPLPRPTTPGGYSLNRVRLPRPFTPFQSGKQIHSALLIGVQGLDQPRMNQRVAGNDASVLDADVTAGEIGHAPPCFTNQQAAGRNIPGRQVLLPEPI